MTKTNRGRLGRIWRKMRPIRKDPVGMLPEEVMHLVWSLLDHKSLLASSRVSASWNAALAEDTVWKKYCLFQEATEESSIDWRKRYLDERSLRYNWSHNNTFTYTKTPVNGKVEASESAIFTWEDNYVTALTPNCNVIKTIVYKSEEKIVSVRWTGLYLALHIIPIRNVNIVNNLSNVSLSSNENAASRNDGRIEFRMEDLDLVTSISVSGNTDIDGDCLVYLSGSCLCHHRIELSKQSSPSCNVKNDCVDSSAKQFFYVCKKSIPVPECRKVEKILIAGKGILARILDNSLETVHALYRSESWSVLNKIERTPLGERVFRELASGDFVLLVHWVHFEGIYLYSNVNIFRGAKLVSRESICNCRREYFSACFGKDSVVYSVAEYRFVLLDLDSLNSREIYVKVGFHDVSRILDRFLVVVYTDRLDVLDSGKVVYSLSLSKPVIIRDTFLVTTCSKLAGLRSLQVNSFRQPEFFS